MLLELPSVGALPEGRADAPAAPRLLVTQSADAALATSRELAGSDHSVRAAPLATFYIEDDGDIAPAKASATAPSSPVLSRAVSCV